MKLLEPRFWQNGWNAAKKIKSKASKSKCTVSLSKHTSLPQIIIKCKNISSAGIPYEMPKKTK